MKGKKVLKVFLVTMVVVTMLAQVAAFAAPTYTTSTVYDNATGKAKVTSTIYGVTAGEEITFLVEDAADNILYIDQINQADYTATGTESASFTYLVNADEADGTASVRFATTSNAASAVTPSDGGVSATPTPGDDDTITLAYANLSYTVVGNGTVFVDDASDVYVDTTTPSGSKTPIYSGQEVTFHCAPDAGYEFTGYKVGDGDKVIADAGNDIFTYTADGTAKALEIYFEKITGVTSDSIAVTAEEPIVVADASNATVRSISQFVTITTGAEKASEYGILVSKDASAIGGISASNAIDELSYSESNTVRKFAALGSYENKYAVQLVDTRTEGNYFEEGTVYIRAYAKAPSSTGAVYAISDVYKADLINGTVTQITNSSEVE